MLDLKSLAVDPKKVDDGVWVEVFGAKFLLARYNNRAAENHRTAQMVEIYDSLASTTKQDTEALQAKLDEIEDQALSQYIVKDWKEVYVGDEKIEYSPEKAYEILHDPKYQDLRNHLIRQSGKYQNYSDANEKKAIKDVKHTAAS